MLEQQNKQIPQQYKVLNFTHPKIGSRKFHAMNTQTLSQFRVAIQMATQLFLFSNYDFEYKGNKLSDLVSIGDMIHEQQAQIIIVINLFDYRSAKHHLSRVMEVLDNPELYLYLISKGSQTSYEKDKEIEISKTQIPKYIRDFNIQDLKPDLGSKILTKQNDSHKIQVLYSISLSGFNPPPTSEKLNGDLFYIHARSLEGQDLHITASPYGFYLNQSKISNFNPNKSINHKNVYVNLIDLLKAASQKFRCNLENFIFNTKVTDAMRYRFQSLDKIKKMKWLEVSENEHGWNSRKNFVDTHIKVDLLSLKDWNESFQIEHQLSIDNQAPSQEKLAQLSKIYGQFSSAALEGAVFLVDGKISPLNPTDEKKKHIYIYNKIFFSIANETPYDHSQEKGQDATPSSSAINTDLQNISILHSLGIPQLHILHTMIVSYRGYKVIAQCIIPGILSVDQINCSQYGSIDDGKTIENNPQFQKIMIEVCKKLNLEDNILVEDCNGVKKRIAGSPDVKGILGSDKRKYILDLLRLSPRDLNYQGPKNQTCVLRKQLIKQFFQGKDKSKMPKINTNIGTEIVFEKNDDYQKQEELLKDLSAYLRKTAIPNLINMLKNSPSQYLTDNSGITKAFHSWGVNMRYLGEVLSHPDLKYEPQIKIVLERIILVRCLKHLFRSAMRQSSVMHLGATIINILNSIFARKNHLIFMEEGMVGQYKNEENIQKQSKKKKKKKNKEVTENLQQNYKDMSQIINVIKVPINKYATMKPSEAWAEVCLIANSRYNHKFVQNLQALQIFKLPFQKIATLRDICLSVGIVLEKKNYDIIEDHNCQSDKIPPFNIKNIISLQARPKHMQISPVNLYEREKEAEKSIQKYQVKEALKLDTLLEKQNLMISGGLNEVAIRLYTRMSRILYILGDNKSAIAQEQKNLSMLDALFSQDHALVIQSHLNLGLYYIALGDKERVIYHMKKSFYLMLIAFGETSPDLLICLANLARIYQLNKDYQEAIICYDVALDLIKKIHGKYHVKISFCYTSLATISNEMGNIKKAIEYQTQNVGVLTQIFADNDSRLQDGIKILKMYRQMSQKIDMQNNMQYIGNNMNRFSEPYKQEEEKSKKKPGKK